MIRIQVRKKLLMADCPRELALDLHLKAGSFHTLYGASGAGKTTVLRILAGLVQPDEGMIEVNGDIWLDTSRKICLPPQKRKIGFVFQDYALFPNMTVRENLAFALPDKGNRQVIADLLALASLQELADRKPASLSGGQQQRVALVRALVRRPQVLLLDEPLSALDLEMRQTLQGEIHRLHQAFGTTTLMVSHQMSEIYRLSDHLLWLEQGQVIRQGPPGEVFGSRQLSSKIQLKGELLSIKANEVIFILEILVGNNIIKVVASPEEVQGLQPGDTVTVFSKAFNPLVRKG
ncbi:MAG: ABC transporter ATP-binding protein [Adhaeribacter sp.]